VLLEVLALGVAHGDGGISVAEKVAHGASNNIAAAKNNGVLALDVDASLLEEDHDTLGGAGYEEGAASPLGELANVGGAEAIDVLLVTNGRGDGVLVEVFGEGELDKEAMNAGVVVKPVDLVEELGLADGGGEMEEFAVNVGLGGNVLMAIDECFRRCLSYLFSSLQLHAHVGGCGIVSYL
jgi:hypothetical protein